MGPDAFKSEVLRERALLGDKPSVEAVRAAVFRLQALGPPDTVRQWGESFVLLEGLAALGWPETPDATPEDIAALEAPVE